MQQDENAEPPAAARFVKPVQAAAGANQVPGSIAFPPRVLLVLGAPALKRLRAAALVFLVISLLEAALHFSARWIFLSLQHTQEKAAVAMTARFVPAKLLTRTGLSHTR